MAKIFTAKTEGKGFINFENTYLQPQSIRILKNEDYIKLDTSKYYAIIVGSDQIWRDDYFIHSFEYSPYLFFVKNKNIKKLVTRRHLVKMNVSTLKKDEKNRKTFKRLSCYFCT